MLTTPFHPRLAELNTTGLWTHWSGHLSALRYGASVKHEYFAVRNAVGVFDTSPLYTYAVRGPEAEAFLSGVLVRDPRACRPGTTQYTVLADDRGCVMEDGVLLRHATDDFWLSLARPELGHLQDLARRHRVEILDVSEHHGTLAVQGPRSRVVLSALDPAVEALPYGAHTPAKIGGAAVVVSRTGYTGDLGYEIWVDADAALPVLDAVLEAGAGHAIRPFGELALGTLRIEAGLPLVDVDFTNSRLAWTDRDRVTPYELGLGWMLRDLDDASRPFLGRGALLAERQRGPQWATVGIAVDPAHWAQLHRAAGLLPVKDEQPLPYESVLYAEPGDDGDARGEQIGWVPSFCYSPVLQRHIGLARLRTPYAAVGTPVRLETTLDHVPTTVRARTTRLPFFDPARKRA